MVFNCVENCVWIVEIRKGWLNVLRRGLLIPPSLPSFVGVFTSSHHDRWFGIETLLTIFKKPLENHLKIIWKKESWTLLQANHWEKVHLEALEHFIWMHRINDFSCGFSISSILVTFVPRIIWPASSSSPPEPRVERIH